MDTSIQLFENQLEKWKLRFPQNAKLELNTVEVSTNKKKLRQPRIVEKRIINVCTEKCIENSNMYVST